MKPQEGEGRRPPCWMGLGGWLLGHLSCCFSEWCFERTPLGRSASWPLPPPRTTRRCCRWVSGRSPPVNSTPPARRKLSGINCLTIAVQPAPAELADAWLAPLPRPQVRSSLGIVSAAGWRLSPGSVRRVQPWFLQPGGWVFSWQVPLLLLWPGLGCPPAPHRHRGKAARGRARPGGLQRRQRPAHAWVTPEHAWVTPRGCVGAPRSTRGHRGTPHGPTGPETRPGPHCRGPRGSVARCRREEAALGPLCLHGVSSVVASRAGRLDVKVDRVCL